MNEKLINKIKELKNKNNVVILAHNYQLPEVQDIADYVGDSLGLSQQAAKTNAEIILFCGVDFMAETAKILSPNKLVLMPDINATCPMAEMIKPKDLIKLKEEYEDALVVSYVNTKAEIKALSDYCCTSANAIKVVNSIKNNNKIIFVPDQYLGDYVRRRTDKELILYPGYCPVHIKISKEEILRLKQEHKTAKVFVHPECKPDVIDIADSVLSTSGIVKYAKETEADKIIIGTEIGILHRLRKENPSKVFYPAYDYAICPNMKLTNLEKILYSLEELKYEIKVDEDIIIKSKQAIDRMLELV